MAKAIFNCIVILQSLDPRDRKAGQQLYDDLDIAIGDDISLVFQNVDNTRGAV